MRATEFLQEQLLDDVAMNPSRLKQMAAQTGAIAGIEFEMLVPGAKTDDEVESEPDFDSDERVRLFDDIEYFFSGGEVFDDRRKIQRLINNNTYIRKLSNGKMIKETVFGNPVLK